MKRVLLAAGAALALAASAVAPMAQAQDDGGAEFRATTLHLSADGEVKAKPDLAVINVGVRVEALTAAAALAQNRTQMNAALAALKAQGVPDSDIQTSNLSLEPQYNFDKGARHLTGYQAANTVSAKLHEMKRIGGVVDALVSAGANQIDGISFQVADPKPLEEAARREAVKALQAKADLLAQAAGYRVQRLVRLAEGAGFGGIAPQPVAMARMVAQSATTVEPGELSVRVTVNGTYELSR
jgi:uncharacterized protein YggE